MLKPSGHPGENEYGEIFDQRGRLYHRAMQTYPNCRSQEFLSVIAQADIGARMTVVDVPSGGAYLANYLDDVRLIGLETSRAFADLAEGRTRSVLVYENDRFPLKQNSADRVLSIAGLHHVQKKTSLFAETNRVLKPGGRLVVADVEASSPVRRFLDEFVGRYCQTGHSGWYFCDGTKEELSSADLNVTSDRMLEYQWVAPDREQLADFCRTLFGMVRADNATVIEGIGDYLGFVDHEGHCGLNWELRCFCCKATKG
jgi:SAM-dependent methyltransferase